MQRYLPALRTFLKKKMRYYGTELMRTTEHLSAWYSSTTHHSTSYEKRIGFAGGARTPPPPLQY